MILPLLPSRPACTACDLHTGAHSVGTPSTWFPQSLPPSHSADCVIFVGQNPGYNEDSQNEPFVGESGRLVKSSFILAPGLHTIASIYFSNAARCVTPTGEPKDRHYRACQPWLREDLDAILAAHSAARHRCIVCLGAPAVAWVSHLLAPSRKRPTLSEGFRTQGRIIQREGGGTVAIFSCYHPAYILRERKMIHAARDHLSLLFDHLEDLTPPRSAPTVIPPRYPITA